MTAVSSGVTPVQHERAGARNLWVMWGFQKHNQCLIFCSLSHTTKCLLDTAAFARQEYTSLAEVVFLISVQTQTFSVSNKQNVQSHLLLSSV